MKVFHGFDIFSARLGRLVVGVIEFAAIEELCGRIGTVISRVRHDLLNNL